MGPARAKERAGLVHALQQLGCVHVTSAYWASLPSADGTQPDVKQSFYDACIAKKHVAD